MKNAPGTAVHKGHAPGDLMFSAGDDASQVTSIGGTLDIRHDVTCAMPQLASIGVYPVPEPEAARGLQQLLRLLIDGPLPLPARQTASTPSRSDQSATAPPQAPCSEAEGSAPRIKAPDGAAQGMMI